MLSREEYEERRRRIDDEHEAALARGARAHGTPEGRGLGASRSAAPSLGRDGGIIGGLRAFTEPERCFARHLCGFRGFLGGFGVFLGGFTGQATGFEAICVSSAPFSVASHP